MLVVGLDVWTFGQLAFHSSIAHFTIDNLLIYCKKSMSEVINENVINTEVEAKTVQTVETVETVQTVAVETVEDATGNMEVATGTSAGVVDVKDLVDNREYKKIAEYFSTLTGSSEEARKMLQMVLNTLPAPVGSVMNPRKRPAPSASSSSVATTPSVTDVDAFLIQDSMDAGVVSALIQIPNDPAVIGSIIGPRGSTIKVSLLYEDNFYVIM